jgi:hypothetical protein
MPTSVVEKYLLAQNKLTTLSTVRKNLRFEKVTPLNLTSPHSLTTGVVKTSPSLSANKIKTLSQVKAKKIDVLTPSRINIFNINSRVRPNLRPKLSVKILLQS